MNMKDGKEVDRKIRKKKKEKKELSLCKKITREEDRSVHGCLGVGV